MFFYNGDKISLRGIRKEDKELYRAWCDNANATSFMETGAWPLGDNDLDVLYELSSNSKDNIVFVIVDNSTGKAVGTCGLYMVQWVCRRAEFRILIGEDDARNKGFGTEAAQFAVKYAFDKLNLETLYLGVNTENIGAVKSYENAGFITEGVRRRMVYRNRRYYDIQMMSILRDEYLEKIAD